MKTIDEVSQYASVLIDQINEIIEAKQAELAALPEALQEELPGKALDAEIIGLENAVLGIQVAIDEFSNAKEQPEEMKAKAH
jgi:hypothetical protein